MPSLSHASHDVYNRMALLRMGMIAPLNVDRCVVLGSDCACSGIGKSRQELNTITRLRSVNKCM